MCLGPGHREDRSTNLVGKSPASHDPGKIVLDVAVALALGGDCHGRH